MSFKFNLEGLFGSLICRNELEGAMRVSYFRGINIHELRVFCCLQTYSTLVIANILFRCLVGYIEVIKLITCLTFSHFYIYERVKFV